MVYMDMFKSETVYSPRLNLPNMKHPCSSPWSWRCASNLASFTPFWALLCVNQVLNGLVFFSRFQTKDKNTPSFCSHFKTSHPWPLTLSAGDFLCYRRVKKTTLARALRLQCYHRQHRNCHAMDVRCAVSAWVTTMDMDTPWIHKKMNAPQNVRAHYVKLFPTYDIKQFLKLIVSLREGVFHEVAVPATTCLINTINKTTYCHFVVYCMYIK